MTSCKYLQVMPFACDTVERRDQWSMSLQWDAARPAGGNDSATTWRRGILADSERGYLATAWRHVWNTLPLLSCEGTQGTGLRYASHGPGSDTHHVSWRMKWQTIAFHAIMCTERSILWPYVGSRQTVTLKFYGRLKEEASRTFFLLVLVFNIFLLRFTSAFTQKDSSVNANHEATTISLSQSMRPPARGSPQWHKKNSKPANESVT